MRVVITDFPDAYVDQDGRIGCETADLDDLLFHLRRITDELQAFADQRDAPIRR